MVPQISTATDRFFFHLGSFFALLFPPNTPKNEHFKKIKKTPKDIINLHMCDKKYG